ncbi:hypothetical protein ASZ90_011167 [hydrocarbon metagenome]|uniref:Uncharacterized protein n=1 Tax=hydrocarbon metagenome TaxID=938273 RepID=A0A0W8FE13_9ZZZZ
MHPSILLQPGTFTVLLAPEERLVQILHRHAPHFQRYLTLYVCGNYSRILNGIDRRCPEFSVQRAFTGFQLQKILAEAHQTIIWVEHDPTLYEENGVPVRLISLALKDAARTSAVVLCSPACDPVLCEMARFADRIFYLETADGRLPYRAQATGLSREKPPSQSQTRLEIF